MKREYRDQIATVLKIKREQKGLTQYKLIELIKEKYNYDIKVQNLSRWETGTNSPPVDAMKVLCDYYGLKISELYGINEGAQQDRAPFNLEKLNAALNKHGLQLSDLDKLTDDKLSLAVSIVKTLLENERK